MLVFLGAEMLAQGIYGQTQSRDSSEENNDGDGDVMGCYRRVDGDARLSQVATRGASADVGRQGHLEQMQGWSKICDARPRGCE